MLRAQKNRLTDGTVSVRRFCRRDGYFEYSLQSYVETETRSYSINIFFSPLSLIPCFVPMAAIIIIIIVVSTMFVLLSIVARHHYKRDTPRIFKVKALFALLKMYSWLISGNSYIRLNYTYTWTWSQITLLNTFMVYGGTQHVLSLLSI